LNTDEEIARAIEYDEQNPIKVGLTPQNWSFVRRDWRGALQHT
jgi:hypothetical protein